MAYYLINTDDSSGSNRYDLWFEHSAAYVATTKHARTLAKLRPGDELFMYVSEGTGVIGLGQVLEQWDMIDHVEPNDKQVYFTPGLTEHRIAVSWTLDLRDDPIDKDTIAAVCGRRHPIQRMEEFKEAKALLAYVAQMHDVTGPVGRFAFPEEQGTDKATEGTRATVTVNRYERSAKARQDCLAEYEFPVCCQVCGFDFGAKYGQLGTGYIHVHHKVPLSEIAEGYQVDHKTDLVPVCPNCHAMLHRGGKTRSIAELKEIIQRQKNESPTPPPARN